MSRIKLPILVQNRNKPIAAVWEDENSEDRYCARTNNNELNFIQLSIHYIHTYLPADGGGDRFLVDSEKKKMKKMKKKKKKTKKKKKHLNV